MQAECKPQRTPSPREDDDIQKHKIASCVMHEHSLDQTYWVSILSQYCYQKCQLIDLRLGERATNMCTAINSIATQIIQICCIIKQ